MINLWVDSRTCQKNPVVTISSNINEVFRAVLDSLFFYYKKGFAGTKSAKSTKNANKHISDFFPLRCFIIRIKTLPFLCLFAYMRFLCLIKIS